MILTGKLVSYPALAHTGIFTLKVYTFECVPQAQTYFYTVGNGAMFIVFAVEQAPDTEVDRKFTLFAVKNVDGSEIENPAFITLTSTSIGD